MNTKTSKAKDNKTTRWLARRAFELRVIDASDWEFIDQNPTRAHEVSEFVEWLTEAPAPVIIRT